MRIGLTGGIACGKSTVAQLFVKRGAKLVDADLVAREVVMPGEQVLRRIVEQFQSYAEQPLLHSDDTLNREVLGRVVFEDEKKLKQLEEMMHPVIRERMKATIDGYLKADPQAIVLADIPLLFETGQADVYDRNIVVYVPKSMQIERLMARNQLTQAEARRRVELQMDIDQKRKLADYIIDNSSTIEHTEHQVEQLWQQWEKSKRS